MVCFICASIQEEFNTVSLSGFLRLSAIIGTVLQMGKELELISSLF